MICMWSAGAVEASVNPTRWSYACKSLLLKRIKTLGLYCCNLGGGKVKLNQFTQLSKAHLKISHLPESGHVADTVSFYVPSDARC